MELDQRCPLGPPAAVFRCLPPLFSPKMFVAARPPRGGWLLGIGVSNCWPQDPLSGYPWLPPICKFAQFDVKVASMWAAAASSCSLQLPPRRYIVQLPPPPSAMAFTGYVRWASSLGRRQSRWARLAREPVRESLLTLACEDDAELVSRFATAARQELGDLVLHDAAHEPLASLCTQSAQGTLPCTAWRAEFARLPAIHAPEPCGAFSEVRGARTSSTWRKERWTALMTHLHAQLPPGAHETRLRAALQLVPSADAAGASGTAETTGAADAKGAADANAALVMLMEGALKITEGGVHAQLEVASPPQLETSPLQLEVASPLQLELLARLRSLPTEGGLGCHSMIHAA